jgi:hypothetical protein
VKWWADLVLLVGQRIVKLVKLNFGKILDWWLVALVLGGGEGRFVDRRYRTYR